MMTIKKEVIGLLIKAVVPATGVIGTLATLCSFVIVDLNETLTARYYIVAAIFYIVLSISIILTLAYVLNKLGENLESPIPILSLKERSYNLQASYYIATVKESPFLTMGRRVCVWGEKDKVYTMIGSGFVSFIERNKPTQITIDQIDVTIKENEDIINAGKWYIKPFIEHKITTLTNNNETNDSTQDEDANAKLDDLDDKEDEHPDIEPNNSSIDEDDEADSGVYKFWLISQDEDNKWDQIESEYEKIKECISEKKERELLHAIYLQSKFYKGKPDPLEEFSKAAKEYSNGLAITILSSLLYNAGDRSGAEDVLTQALNRIDGVDRANVLAEKALLYAKTSHTDAISFLTENLASTSELKELSILWTSLAELFEEIEMNHMASICRLGSIISHSPNDSEYFSAAHKATPELNSIAFALYERIAIADPKSVRNNLAIIYNQMDLKSEAYKLWGKASSSENPKAAANLAKHLTEAKFLNIASEVIDRSPDKEDSYYTQVLADLRSEEYRSNERLKEKRKLAKNATTCAQSLLGSMIIDTSIPDDSWITKNSDWKFKRTNGIWSSEDPISILDQYEIGSLVRLKTQHSKKYRKDESSVWFLDFSDVPFALEYKQSSFTKFALVPEEPTDAV